MVFSFFKKQPEKMPERQAAKPRPAAVAPPLVPEKADDEVGVASQPLADLEFTRSTIASTVGAAANPLGVAPGSADSSLDFTQDSFDDDFGESSVMAIDVSHGQDPLQADIEQIAVLFANGQDALARSLLESFIHAYAGTEAKRFWLLLFDLLQVMGDRPAFERYGMEYAQASETSPPTWREHERKTEQPKAGGPRLLALQGVVTGDDENALSDIQRILDQGGPVVVDCGKLAGMDDAVAGRLADILGEARRKKRPLSLQSVDAFLGRLNARLIAGEARHEPSWRLLLELLQRHGSQDGFEERAVDYAVTFELSPPSWETPPTPVVASVELAAARTDAHYLEGNLKNQRFEALDDILGAMEHPVIDCSGVQRLDFFSAGQLVNRLSSLKAAGKDVVIRRPNHLVAELMVVVGLNKQARIVVSKS